MIPCIMTKPYPKSLFRKEIVASVSRGSPNGVVASALDCDIVVSDFDLQSRYYVHFQTNTPGKGMNVLFPQLWFKSKPRGSSRG